MALPFFIYQSASKFQGMVGRYSPAMPTILSMALEAEIPLGDLTPGRYV